MEPPENRQPEQSTDLVRYVAEEATQELSAFMGTVAGSASIQLGELVGDQVRFWRFKRSLRHAEKAKQMLDDAGLEPHQVPFRTLVPLVESASLEDDDELVNRWAALLANAASEAETVPPSFPSVLRELEPTQARLLDAIYENLMALAPEFRHRFGVRSATLDESFGYGQPRFRYDVDNLARLRLVRALDDEEELTMIGLTEFGRAFVRACRPPGQPDPPLKWTDFESLQAEIRDRDQKEAEEAQARRADPSRDHRPSID